MLHSTDIELSLGSVHEQEHHLTRELELMLDRLESPAWNLAHQSEQASPAQPPVARIPAAYNPRVGPLPPDATAPLPPAFQLHSHTPSAPTQTCVDSATVDPV